MKAAGVLLVAPDKRALFLQRSKSGDHAGEWCLPGGGIEDGETAEEAARREFYEETGGELEGDLAEWTRTAAGGVDFTTFLGRADEFEPELNHEHTAFVWAPLDNPPQPLHPGCIIAIERFAMDELGIARAMRDGRLSSPQKYANVWLFNMRITGTGVAYRRSWEEFVWRDPTLYMTEEFVARCNGLSVIMEHPQKAVLDSKEFGERIVGSIFLPYLKPELEEVWGIAKIYDEKAAELMSSGEFSSTSPSVVFHDPNVNNKLEMEDGQKLLIEGKPSLLDHLAICEQGVWDKGGEPRGVDTSATTGETSMADDNKRVAADTSRSDDSKADASEGTKLDKLLAGLDDMRACMDAMNKRMDSFEEKEKADDDDDDDGEEEDEPKAVAADKKKRRDSVRKDEPSEREEMKEKIAKEKSKEKKSDDDEEEEKAEKKEDEEKEEEKADSRKDSVDKHVQKEIARVEAMIPRVLSDEEYKTFADIQSHADSVYSAFADSAPRPLQGETPLDYRVRLLTKLQAHSDAWKDSNLRVIAKDEKAFANVENAIYADAQKKANDPLAVADGDIRPIETRMASGHTERRYVGRPRSWMGRFAGQRTFVTKIADPDKARS